MNALSRRLEVRVRRGGIEYMMSFAHGEKTSELTEVGKVAKKDTGTTLRFWPDAKYFDSPKFAVPRMRHVLRAKAVLCPGLVVRFYDEAAEEETVWCYEDGLKDYLSGALQEWQTLPTEPFIGRMSSDHEAAEWAVTWLPEGGEAITESYVNLIPTAQGGTHVNGLRSGLTEAIREFCEFRNLCRAACVSPRRTSGSGSVMCCRSSWRTRSSPVRPRSGSPRASAPPSSRGWLRMPSACG